MNFDFNKFRVLIIGDIMIDRYVFGKVDRMSPEAPVPILRATNTENRLGGAANVALNIESLGGNAFLIGGVGKDSDGQLVGSLLEEGGLGQKSHLIELGDRPTTVKSRYFKDGQHLMRVDHEENRPIPMADVDVLVSKVRKLLSTASIDYVILQDYNKGIFYKKSIAKITKLLIEKSIPFGVDPKFDNISDFEASDLFKPNLKEAQKIIGTDFTAHEVVEFGKKIHQELKTKRLFITLGEYGIFGFDGEDVIVLPARKMEVMDVCGAGDAVMAILVLSHLAEFKMEIQAKLAILAGSLSCSKLGVNPVKIDDLRDFWSSLHVDK